MMFKQSLLAASALLVTANAHLFISSPKPIAGSAPKDPLAKDGSNFPCHGVPLPGSGGQSMAVGSQQKLVFDAGLLAAQPSRTSALNSVPTATETPAYEGGLNNAVHGGGSCQLSITYETDSQKVKQASAWKVIYSIEGGCPSNTLGNLIDTYQGPLGPYHNALPCSDPHSNGVDCINDFNYTIPEGVKNGQATLGWTWFNNVGDREIYMNCAAVDITGGSDDATMSEFPEVFLANMGPAYGGGATDAYRNVKFPNPGKYVTTKTAETSQSTTYPIAIPSVLSGAASGPSSYVASSYAAVPSSYAAEPTSYVASSAYAPAPTSYAPIPTLATSVGTAPLPSGTGYVSSYNSSNSTSGSCSGGKVSCPSPGELVCIDDKTFGICDIDYCAVPRPVSLGTTCSNNVVDKRDVVRRRSSRLHRHIPGHIHHKFGF
ncbi:hypothetical protein D6D15_01757 [Aureobasidium pullulans]|uniref:Lytic polysaccharide monooxygenase n=1 Tax=Aureobasidium pullulans TaxID=5580 RepID=A0A4S9BMV8_AURPU|nr:hypothetical protein D6D15_01757 [Aureobasidium pullulans]